MTLYVDYGLITLQRLPGERAGFQSLYADALHYCEVAEGEGFNGVWVSEHHLSPDAYLPSPMTFLAAVAARTNSVTLGTNIAIAPLYHPRRLAEETAVVAAIAGRRVILGLGIGYRVAEYSAFDVTPQRRASHLEACVQFCQAAWSAGTSDEMFGGLPRVDVGPEVWLGGLVPAALARAGRVAGGFIATSASVTALRDRLDVVDRAAREAGRTHPPGLVSNHLVSVSCDGALRPSVASGITHIMDTYRGYARRESDKVISEALSERSSPDPGELAVWGTPGQVAESLGEYVRAFAHEREHRLMVRLHYPGMARVETVEHIRLFAAEVVPRLREIAV